MLAEVPELEPRIKEILYRCLERLRTTKAAFYLFDPSNGYELVTHYGFGDLSRKLLGQNDVIIDRLMMRRAAFFVNGVGTEPRFSDLLFQNGTDRLLVLPLYSRGKLIGLFDARDKAGKLPFDQSDLEHGKKIADEMIELLTEKNLYGLLPPALANDDAADSETVVQNAVARTVIAAQSIVSREVLRARFASNALSQTEMSAVSMVLPSLLSIRSVVMVAFSASGPLGNSQTVVARALVTDETQVQFQAKIAAWLKKRGDEEQEFQVQTIYPFGTGAAPIQVSQLVSILSAPVNVSDLTGLVLTIAFEAAPDAEARKQLEAFLGQIQHTIEHAISHKGLKATLHKVAQKLVEPDFQKLPELVAHSRRVSALTDQFAHHLGLSDAECERIRLAGYVHDVGMRLIDYSRLYRKSPILPAEMKLFKDHCVIGAGLVEPLLGPEIAHAVLCHHERMDGQGYPSQLPGAQIPLASRIIAICDAFDSMTAPDSYQAPISQDAAREKITSVAGAQFDLELVRKFTTMMA
ncbi:MAG TPA: HD domain-containing phosphohydrolase [Thermoanaerobaculia bacterium]|nr:HD domain-containing phosphohydrolase [Thermoanaerobaculia bacterium]